jgi:biotin operon repressor
MDPRLLQQIEQYLRDVGLNATELRKRMDDIRNSTTEFNRELINTQRHFAEMNSSFDDLSQQFKNVIDDLKKFDSTSSRINKSFKTLGGLADKLKYDAEEISRLNKKDLESLDKKARVEISNLKARKAELDLNLKNKNLDDLRLQAIADGDKELIKQIDQYKELSALIDQNGQLTNDENNYVKQLLKLTRERLEEEEKITKTLGISGKIVDGIVGTLDKLGIESSFFENLKEDMRDAAKEAGSTKWSVLKTGLKGIGTGLKEALKDPITQLTIILKVFSFFLDKAKQANKEAVELGKSLGYGAERADAFRENMALTAGFSSNINVNSKSITEAFSQLAESTGLVYEYSADQLETQIKLTKQVGLQADEAANIQKFGVLTGKTSKETYQSFVKGLAVARNQFKVGINFKATLAEASKISGQLAANLGYNPERIGKAVVAMKAFGTTLEQTKNQGEALLNFESSLENELKAELLTGQQINLERARAAALQGDQVALAQELANQGMTLEKFSSMNVLAQKSYAEALGLNSDQLSDQLQKQKQAQESGKSLAQITEEEAAQALERQEAQEKFNSAMEKLMSVVGNLVAGPFGQLLDLLSNIASILTTVISPIITGISFVVGLIVDGFKTLLPVVGALVGIIAALNAKLLINAVLSVAQGAWKALGSIFPVGPVLATAATLAGVGLVKKLASAGDMISPADGRTQVSTKEGGLFQLSKNDDLLAGPGLAGKVGQDGGGESISPQIDLTPMIAAINAVKASIDRLYNKDTSINMDSKKVGTTLSQKSYKVA